MTTDTVAVPGAMPRFFELRPDNWPLAFVLAFVVSVAALVLLPPDISFWVALAACILAAGSAVYNAWGRYKGGLLVAPALALLFVMNIFPLMWSLGLSFFSYRANRAKAPVFVGLDNYADDPHRSGRLGAAPDHGHARRPDGHGADGRRLPACLPFLQAVSAPPLPAHPRAHADDAVLRRGRRLLPLLLRADLRPPLASWSGCSPGSPTSCFRPPKGRWPASSSPTPGCGRRS